MKNKVIGSLLIIILLVRPAVSYAEEINTSQHIEAFPKLVIYVDNYVEEPEYEVSAEDVNYALESMTNGSHTIQSLINQKETILSNIESAMQYKSANKINMTEVQMNLFKNFSEFARINNINTTAYLSKLQIQSDLRPVERELLHSDTDYKKVYSSLAEINDTQKLAISELKDVINFGERLLGNL